MSAVASPARRAGKTAARDQSPHRRSMIGKIHVAKAQLRMADDDYRMLLLREAGVTSSTEATDHGLAKVIDAMKRLGFQPLPPKRGKGPARGADHQAARKARALWLSLHQLGAVHDSSESALEKFARRQLGVAQLQWADQALCYRLIEALKAWAEREGWPQDVSGVPMLNRARVLKQRLLQAMLVRLQKAGLIAEEWTLEEALDRRFGQQLDRWSVESLELAAVTLGQMLREVRS